MREPTYPFPVWGPNARPSMGEQPIAIEQRPVRPVCEWCGAEAEWQVNMVLRTSKYVHPRGFCPARAYVEGVIE